MLTTITWITIVSIATFLFYKGAGTLNPCKANLVNMMFYAIVVQTIVGAALTTIGFHGHYTYLRLNHPAVYTKMAAEYSAVTFIFLPTVIIIFLYAFNISPKEQFDDYLKKQTKILNEKAYYYMTIVFTVPATILLIAFIYKIGYMPLMKLMFDKNFDYAIERHKNVNMMFFGSQYIKNVFILQMIPFLGFIAFSFAISTKKIRWISISVILFIEGIIVNTYDFSKAPIIIYISVYILIVIYFFGGINYKYIIAVFGFFITTLLVQYRILGYKGKFLDLYNGIIGRSFFTEFGTLAMHFEAFDYYYEPLKGRSLYPSILKIIGLSTKDHLRSSEVVMETYNHEGILRGNTGVMNSFFIGEAFANWSIAGIIFSVIYVGIIFAIIFMFFLKIDKTPLTIAVFSFIFVKLVICLHGGFVDFIYNFSFIFIFITSICYYYFGKCYTKINRKKFIKN